MSESRNSIQELESVVTELGSHVLDLRKFSEGQRYEAIPYALQDVLDAQVAVNHAIKEMIDEVNEWRPEILDPKLLAVMAKYPDSELIEFLKERIAAREDLLNQEESQHDQH